MTTVGKLSSISIDYYHYCHNKKNSQLRPPCGRTRKRHSTTVRLNDGQVTGRRTIIKGLSYSALNQLSNEPLFIFQRQLQAKISAER
mmetsp:Transcript_15482/g.31352  ORF Transcript_15482/g.31352 Transcript_15482/m.31352 type:complete len:87 (+) Transcript_15482:1971-2231(+)